jgi:hypothetical protein
MLAAKVRNALTFYLPHSEIPNIEIRLHETILYNSIFRADDQLLVNQHAYGVPAAHSPVFLYRMDEGTDISTAYLRSFETVWESAKSEL